MATNRAILRANKAVPGAAARTPAPQGDYPWIGQLNQAFSQPGDGYSRAYPPFLPRPPQTFTEGAFGPFSPILPVPIDTPPPGFDRPQPRRWQPYVGYNLPIGQPGTEGYKLASFATLKALGDYYSIMRTCLEIRKQEIRALNWDIALTSEAAKAYRGDKKAMRDFGERRAAAKRFFSKPDPNYFDFSSWLYASMEQVFVYDALSLYMCPKKGRGMGRGLLGSDLDCLWSIDGAGIRPLMGLHGEVPAPPAPGYQQYEFGVPRADLATMVDDRDLDSGEAGHLQAQVRGDQLIYVPYVPRVDSPYGFSLVEQAIIPIMTGLRKQAYQLSFFDENTTPAVYISPGDASMTPNQIRELQLALNAVAGQNAVWNFKVIVLPPGSKTMPQKEMQIVDQADEWIATEVAMVASINPMEIGVLPKISTVASPFAAREMAQAQKSIHQRVATKPTLSFLTAIPDFILQNVCRQEDMRFLFDGMEEEADLAAQNDMDVKDVQSGIKSIDEVRDSRGLVPWDLPETTEPIVITQNGPLPLSAASALAQAAMGQALAGPSEGSDTGAHAAARGGTSGKRNAKTIPLGSSGAGRMNGPVTQRQARRGGALAPAHATAEGAPGHSGGKAATVVPAAAHAELGALGRHLRKGRDIATWQPVHLPVSVLETIAHDLRNGWGPDTAIADGMDSLEKALVLGATEYAWADGEAMPVPKAQGGGGTPPSQQQQARQQAQALAQQYAARIQAAFTAAMNAAAKLIAAWAAGTLTVTVAVLAGMIANEIRKRLGRVLAALWRRAWALGQQAAEQAVGGKTGKQAAKEALAAFLATVGADWAGLISDTRMRALADALTTALRDGKDPRAIVDEMERILQVLVRSEMIAVTEITRAQNAAALAVFKVLGVAYKRWQTRNDSRVCARCMANQNQGAIPLDALFASGTAAPGLHPRCRCWLVPAKAPDVTAVKALRRQVDVNGEVTWHDEDVPQENAAGGGAVPPRSHVTTGNGVQEDIPGSTPGISAGGEPSRWDGTQPFPYVRDIDGGDDSRQGGERGLGSRPGRDWPSGYMDEFRGWWPQGGHGCSQPPGMEVGSGFRGRAPNAVGKTATAAGFLSEAPKAKASAVFAQLSGNYPPESIAWVRRASWHGPSEVPLPLIDWSGRKTWAADKETSKVDEFARQLRAKEHVNPVVAIAEPGKRRYRLIDGHHRALACKELGWPVRAWIAEVADPGDLKAAWETHASQIHQGSSEQNKSFTAGATGGAGVVSGLVPLGHPVRTGPYVAGLMVRAEDTGRVLMLQRAITEDDPAAGLLEPPGGHVAEGETLLQGAWREWAEETGLTPPAKAVLTGSWTSADGIYRGFVVEVPSEDVLDLGDGRDQVVNPDNPDGDVFEALLFVDPALFAGNPMVRPEMQRDWAQVRAALDGAMKSAQTPVVSTVHHPLGHEGLWHTPSKKVPEMQQLPAYHQNTARALMRDQGMGESQAIATAINAIREWKSGRAFGGRVKVTPEVQAAAARADAEFEALRAAHH